LTAKRRRGSRNVDKSRNKNVTERHVTGGSFSRRQNESLRAAASTMRATIAETQVAPQV